MKTFIIDPFGPFGPRGPFGTIGQKDGWAWCHLGHAQNDKKGFVSGDCEPAAFLPETPVLADRSDRSRVDPTCDACFGEASLARDLFMFRGIPIEAFPEVSLTDLAEGWHMARIVVLCERAGDLARDVATVAKIRGGLGRRLHDAASQPARAGKPCPWQPPCAWDLLFNDAGSLGPSLAIPAPFVIALDRVGQDLAVSLTLFGIAADVAGEVAAALVESLRNGLDESGDRRRPLSPIAREIGMAVGVPLPTHGGTLLLDFVTPLALRQGQEIHADPASLILSLGNRVAGLALWQGARLALDASALKIEAERLAQLAEWSEARARHWHSGSQAQGRRMPLAGLVGQLTLPVASEDVTTLLALGAECHAGARTTKGQGRYRLYQI